MGKPMEYFNTDVPEYRKAIWNYVCFDPEGEQDVNVPFERFRPSGFIDCMTTQTSRPRSGPRNEEQEREDDDYAIQRAFFTSYGKTWWMKTQAIYLPNGMVPHVFFTSIAQNDNGVINISGIEEELERVLNDYMLPGNISPAIYGDEIYIASTVLVKRNGAQDRLHDRMTAARVDIEHCFGSCNNLFARLTVKHTWKLCFMRHYVKTHLFSIFLC